MSLEDELNNIQSMLARSSMSQFEYDEISKKIISMKTKYVSDTITITPTEILSIIGVYFNLPKDYFKIKTRKREYVLARQMAYKILIETTKLTLEQIADFFEQDHTTAIHSKKTANNLIETNRGIRNDYNNIIILIDRGKYSSK